MEKLFDKWVEVEHEYEDVPTDTMDKLAIKMFVEGRGRVEGRSAEYRRRRGIFREVEKAAIDL
jgi:hypothetical protein